MSTIPGSGDIQFSPASGTLFVDDLIDPGGAPGNVLDIDLGFTIKGRVLLPSFLSGQGLVKITASERGGPFNDTVGVKTLTIAGAASPTDPPSISYPFEIEIKTPAMPGGSKLYDLGVIFVLQTAAGGPTRIAGFYDLGPFLIT